MPMQQMLLGAGGAAPVKVQDVFSVDLWTGNATQRNISNDVNISGEGGMVWIKCRNASYTHTITDTERGYNKVLYPNNDNGLWMATNEVTLTNHVKSFNSDGYTIGTHNEVNRNEKTYVGWTFRKHPKFFDIQEATMGADDSTYATTLTHQLECDVGMAVFKSRNIYGSQGTNWLVWHKQGCTGANQFWRWNTSDGRQSQNNTVNYNSSYKTFTFGYPAAQMQDRMRPGTGAASDVIGYFFADNNGSGEFGSGGDEDIIKTGTYTGNGSTAGPSAVNLGWEPQYLMVKRLNASAYWIVWDSTRGVVAGAWNNMTYTEPHLKVNENYAENYPTGTDMMEFTSTGFQPRSNDSAVNSGGNLYIYLAIRKDQS